MFFLKFFFFKMCLICVFLVFITAMLVLCFVSLDMVFFGCIKQLVGELVLSKN